MSTTSTVPEKHEAETKRLTDYWVAMMGPLQGVAPMLEASVHFAPSPMVDDSGGGEPLSDYGRLFVRSVYGFLCEALEAASDAVYRLPPRDAAHKDFQERSDDAFKLAHTAVLVARGLMEPDLPSDVSGHDALEELLKLVNDALAIVEPLRPGSTS